MDHLLSINKGKLILYNVFDVGNEIDLEKASITLEQGLSPLRFRLKKESKALIINNAPLTLSLGQWQYSTHNANFDVEIVGKIWYFGAISIGFQFNIPPNTDLSKIVLMAQTIENDPQILVHAKQKLRDIVGQLPNCIDKVEIWETFEDYLVLFVESFTDTALTNATDLFSHKEIYSFLLSDNIDNFSDSIKKTVTDNYFQYGTNDLALIEWNSAFIVEPSGSLDVVDVIEFSLCQLLEMRYYDDLLDNKLNHLYSSLIDDKGSILSDHYSKISKEAAQKYLELSEIVENIENSLKIIGDFYYARIYRNASNRFRIKDWQASVDNKLNNLAEVSKLLHTSISEKRSALLELIIVMLITIELFPLIWSFFNQGQ